MNAGLRRVIGRWRIRHMEVWDQDYVDLVVPGYIEIEPEMAKDRFSSELFLEVWTAAFDESATSRFSSGVGVVNLALTMVAGEAGRKSKTTSSSAASSSIEVMIRRLSPSEIGGKKMWGAYRSRDRHVWPIGILRTFSRCSGRVFSVTY
jgi:hypothetical protein